LDRVVRQNIDQRTLSRCLGSKERANSTDIGGKSRLQKALCAEGARGLRRVLLASEEIPKEVPAVSWGGVAGVRKRMQRMRPDCRSPCMSS
jgi:hypothetical protein